MVYFDDLIWDDRNEEHIARHGVTPNEATAAVRNAAFMTHARNGAYQLVGVTDGGRSIAVILRRQEGHVYYVVTARNATREEQRRYRRH